MTVAELKSEAERLPEKERGILAADLLNTLSPSHYDVTDAEVAHRVEETESGAVEDISLEELTSRVKNARGA